MVAIEVSSRLKLTGIVQGKSSATSNCIANEKTRRRHVLRTQQSNMQPDLRMHVCEHNICFLHQVCSVLDKRNTIGFEWLKDVNEKQRFIVKHGLVGLCSNPGESIIVRKCIVPLRHGGTLNSHRAASPLVRLVEGDIKKSHSLSSLLNYLRAFGDGPVAGVPGGQGIESWLACLEFEPSATKDAGAAVAQWLSYPTMAGMS
ncbi:hypothetical protein TNCV_804061 [Trichonephila clavipes]|nr:hypothetical protein TNCV_804061 [Trichonephila clavipes]